MKTAWKYGEQKRLAELASCNLTHLNDIIHGRKNCPPPLAVRLEAAAKELGRDIPRSVWVFRDLRKHFGDLFPNQ